MNAAPSSQPRTYADHVVDYAQAGWPCILPVPPETKSPPPVGFTGAEGRDTDPLTIVEWAGKMPGHSIALRMPESVIGIDVDQYVKKGVQKRGAETLAACIERWGPLPATWTSTAREAGGPSRIYFFRVPPRRYATKLVGPESGDVEVIQRHHRYAVVWPSPHGEAGGTYTWYDPTGQASDHPPKPDEFPELPAAWVEGLSEGATEQGPASADRASGETMLGALEGDHRPECADVTSARLQALDELARSDAGSRHDTMTARIHHLVQLGAHGHTGVGMAFAELRETWARITAGEDRAEELERMLLTSARKAVTVVGVHPVPRDPCLLFAGGFPSPAPSPGRGADGAGGGSADGEEGAEALQIQEPPRWMSVRELIGTQAFDPNAGLDQSLAEAVLARTWPALRYAYDAGTWLLRAPESWEPHKDLSSWAVAQVSPLMPIGDPTAEKGSDQHERSRRRARLMTSAGASAVSNLMKALVKAGTHPVAVALADLDADPEVLWAGGYPWSLRGSVEGPVLAEYVDPAAPHLLSAAVTPQPVATPLWDAFLAAVWPDPEIRRWALRVLSIAVTGYADRALPILLGDTGRGKTQVVHLLMSVLGGYAHAADPRLLSEAGDRSHASIVYALKGRRLSFIDEGPREGRWAQERLKQLTGGGALTANQMNQNPITFLSTHTMVLTANEEPLLTDPAVRARTRLIPCDGDPELVRETRMAIGHVSGAVWQAEAPGVLASLMAEAAAWLAEPDTAMVTAAPEHIRYLAEHLGAAQDPVAVWVTEETEPCEEGTPGRELYQAFVASCRRNSMRADQIPSETKWGRALTRLGYPSRHTMTGKRRDLRLRQHGFLPGMAPLQTPSVSVDPQPVIPTGHDQPTVTPNSESGADTSQIDDGLTPEYDGLVTGSNADPSSANPQVTPSVSVGNDGYDGLNDCYTPQVEAATTLEIQRQGEIRLNPSFESVAGEPSVTPKKPGREQTETAREKAAQVRAEKRAAAITAAAGKRVELPAVVTPEGLVQNLSWESAATLLEPVTELTVDVEHTGYPVGHELYALRTIQLGNEHFSVVLDATDPAQAELAAVVLARAEVLHAHSATADLVPLAVAGLIDLDAAWSKMTDTAVLAKLADPVGTENGADLKKVSKATLGKRALSPAADEARSALFKAGGWLTETEVTTPIERSGWAQADPRCTTMVRYAGADVIDDAALARALPQPTGEVMHREREVQRMTGRVAYAGIRLEPDHVRTLRDEHLTAKDVHSAEVRAYGVDNPGSNPQVAEAFGRQGIRLPLTEKGKPSVAAAVLEPMRETVDLARAVLDFRHHDTALKLLLEPYHELVTRGDGRARPTVYTLGAKTGRMSCVRPNLQQVSRQGGMRACFTADPGQLLISADFAQVELRVAAALSQDPQLVAYVLDDDKDLHWDVARIAFGPQATKAQRYRVKRGVFGRIYGGGVPAVAAGVGVDHPTAQRVIDAMDALTPGLTEWSRMVRNSIEAGSVYFQAYSGRTIHLPKGSPHAGPNYCIQGTARELLMDALMRWRETRWGESVMFPVHDEVVAVVPEAEAEEATAALVECMTADLHGIPIKVDPGRPSFFWEDAE